MNVLNTLFVLTPGAYVTKDHRNLVVKVDGEPRIRVPIHGLSSVVCFGHTLVSPEAMGSAAANGVLVSFFSQTGRFVARVEGVGRGSLNLRRAQLRATEDDTVTSEIARAIVLGKIANSRQLLLRRARESGSAEAAAKLATSADHLTRLVPSLQGATTPDEIRGYEGDAAARYFGAFGACISVEGFVFEKRSRRPPRDPVNALLSFAYAMLLNDCVAALAGVGLDPDAGFLHRDRPGRPSLGLDLMEELRSPFADRLVLAMLNRNQLRPNDFTVERTGGVSLTEGARRNFLASYQTRKQEEVNHAFLHQAVPWALVPHLQARLLARHLRGDLDAYPPFTLR
jgi:CRISPR-associated protein Cas1